MRRVRQTPTRPQQCVLGADQWALLQRGQAIRYKASPRPRQKLHSARSDGFSLLTTRIFTDRGSNGYRCTGYHRDAAAREGLLHEKGLGNVLGTSPAIRPMFELIQR